MNKRSLHTTPPTLTSHNIGEKRVLLSNDETVTAITQIAVTTLIAAQEVETHAHPTMEEYFLFRKGVATLTIAGEIIECAADDFVVVPPGTPHKLKAITDIEVLTIGCATY